MSDKQNQIFFTKLRKFWHPINIYNNLKSLYLAIIPKGSKVYNFTSGLFQSSFKRLNLINVYYQEWIKRFDQLTEDEASQIREKIGQMGSLPAFSIVMPVYNPPPDLLEQAIQSAIDQVYPHWQLCIADDASTDPHIKRVLNTYAEKDSRIQITFRKENGHISAASNSAIDLVENEYMVLLDHDDLLHPLALYYVALALQKKPDCVVIYSDEDKITRGGRRLDPYFKPDFDPELILSQNMVSHLGVYKASAVRMVGGFRLGLEGSQDYDLLLRVIETCTPEQIHHISRPLYHWRILKESAARDLNVKPYAINAGTRAISEHLERRGIRGEVRFLPELAGYAVNYLLPSPPPSITLIIRVSSITETLIDTLYTIINQTDCLDYKICLCMPEGIEELPQSHHDRLQGKVILKRLSRPVFSSYSRSINQCIESIATGFFCLVDETLSGFSQIWLTTLLGQAIQPGIGAVAPRLIDQEQRVYSNGIVFLPHKPPEHLSRGEKVSVNRYFGWAKLTRGYSALSEKCILFSTDLFKSLGGFDAEFSDPFYANADLCLRLKTAGHRNIMVPAISLYIHKTRLYNKSESASFQYEDPDLNLFTQRWQNWMENDPSFNPNLTIYDEGIILVNLSPRQIEPGL